MDNATSFTHSHADTGMMVRDIAPCSYVGIIIFFRDSTGVVECPMKGRHTLLFDQGPPDGDRDNEESADIAHTSSTIGHRLGLALKSAPWLSNARGCTQRLTR